MLRHAEVGLNLVELAGGDYAEGVLLGVDGTLLQSGEQLAEGHGRGVRAHGAEGAHVNLVLHGADLDALQIVGDGDGALAVGDVAHAVLHEAQALDADVVQAGEHLLAHLAVAQQLALLAAFKQEGQIEDQQLVGEARQGGAHHDAGLNRVHLHALDAVPVAGQLGAVEHIHMQAAAALLLQQLGKLEDALNRRVILGVGAGGDPGELGLAGGLGAVVRLGGVGLRGVVAPGGGLLGLAAAAAQKAEAQSQRKGQGNDSFHV